MRFNDCFSGLAIFEEHVVNEGAGMYAYSLSAGEFTFTVMVFEFGYDVSVKITHCSLPSSIIYFNLNEVSKIVCDEKGDGRTDLVFYKRDESRPLLTVTVKPYLHISYTFE